MPQLKRHGMHIQSSVTAHTTQRSMGLLPLDIGRQRRCTLPCLLSWSYVGVMGRAYPQRRGLLPPSPSLPPIFLPTCTYLPSYLYLPTHLPTYPPTHLPTYLPTYPPTYLPTYQLASTSRMRRRSPRFLARAPSRSTFIRSSGRRSSSTNRWEYYVKRPHLSTS
jgi:hypothetical protein